MEFATGAIGTLLPKLALLLRDEYYLQKSVKNGIMFLQREFESMQEFLKKVSNVPLDQLDDQVKIWARDVRELSYDIEDRIDSFIVCVDDPRPAKKRKSSGFIGGFIEKCCKSLCKVKARHKMANDINDVRRKINEVAERYNRYKIDDLPSNHSAIDPRIPVLYEKVSNLVGTGKASDDLIRQLSEGGNTANNLKVVAVLGFGGLGKTTLAKVVFDMLKNQFDSSCFVPVGQGHNAKKALKDICIELHMEMREEMDERQLIDRLRGFLDKRRYLIVIDDMWETSTWQLIKHALIESNCGSRVIVTTRISHVAVEVGDIYNMEPLSDEYSKDLLYTRIGNGPPDNNQSAEAVKKILQKCGGVPLSIITIASLLAGKPIDDWTKVYNSIGFGSNDRNQVVENTRKILSFSYYDLPSYLKTCLLYLNIYPEDHLIRKDELIWKWVAEGFIKKEHGAELYEVGERYFTELINKSLIQPTTEEYTGFDVVDGCRVHDMVLDLIRILAMEENFVKVLDTDHDREQYCSSSSQTCTARRIAMHMQYGSVLTLSTSQVRSFNAFDCPDIGTTPSLLTSFRILRVLSLHDCGHISLDDLKHLGKLLQLRYLALSGMEVDELPSEIGDLAHLQSLDISDLRLHALPATVIELSNLLRLRINYNTRMPSGVGKLTSLQELKIGNINAWPNLATELGKLTDLRKLQFVIGKDLGALKLLEESVRCLHNLQDLVIMGILKDMEWDDWELSCQLRKLVVPSVLACLPSWVNPTRLPNLTYLHLRIRVLDAQGELDVLARMPALRYLYITPDLYKKKAVSWTVNGGGLFRDLRQAVFNCIALKFVLGAMPMLSKIEFMVRGTNGADVGLVNLPLLNRTRVQIDTTDCTDREVEVARSALTREVNAHPNRPKLDCLELPLPRHNNRAKEISDASAKKGKEISDAAEESEEQEEDACTESQADNRAANEHAAHQA